MCINKSILITTIWFLLFFNLSFSQQDTSKKITVKDFKLSYEYLEKFTNDLGIKDSVYKTRRLTECENPMVIEDTLLSINHSTGKTFVPFNRITKLSFKSSTCTIPGVVIGAVTGLSVAALAGIVYTLTQTQHDSKAGHVGLVIFAISAQFCALGGAIPGGIIGSKIHQYKSFNLDEYPDSKRKEETLRLLNERSKFKEF
ncbi:MAG: hypothetical protein NTU73_15500 [Ignavibacteriae bacterium]|nr:hypothetical protein [Ignavibacteriota bacterium]